MTDKLLYVDSLAVEFIVLHGGLCDKCNKTVYVGRPKYYHAVRVTYDRKIDCIVSYRRSIWRNKEGLVIYKWAREY